MLLLLALLWQLPEGESAPPEADMGGREGDGEQELGAPAADEEEGEDGGEETASTAPALSLSLSALLASAAAFFSTSS